MTETLAAGNTAIIINTLKIIQHNVLNWRTNKQSLITNYLEVKPEIILLNSHGLKSNESLKIPGYTCYKVNSEESLSDGSAIAVKHKLKHKLIDDFETDFLAIEIHTTQGPLVIATTYLPPRRPYLPFPDVYRLINNNTPTLILGDFNCSHTQFGNRTNNTVGKSIINLINQGKLIHLGPQFPTFIRQESATNPDKIFSNKHNYLNTYIEHGNITSSDHIPIILTVSTKPIFIKTKENYQFKRADWDKFQQILDDKVTEKNLNNSNVNQIEMEMSNWMNAVKYAMNQTIPKNTHKPLYQTKSTPQIRQLEHEYSTLRANAEINGWTQERYRLHTQIRHQIRELCMEAFNKNWEDNITNTIQVSHDTKAFWRKIKQLKGNSHTHTNYLEDHEGNKYYTEEEQCSIMENTWRDIFRITEEDEQSFDEQHSTHIETYIQLHSHRTKPFFNSDFTRLDNHSFYTRPVTPEEIKKHINKFKNKAPGSSSINKNVLEKCPNKTIKALTNIFNACLSIGHFPKILKSAVIKFIPKENKNPKNPINYRPISLLETPGKILEKVILSRLNAFLVDNKVIKDRQHGFRANRGTATAIATTYEKIANALADKNQVIVVLRDVSKAFDKVWHSGLKYKLLQFGLPSILEKILCTFLDDRSANISIGNHLSQTISIFSGVPQGSVLSPTLYSLFTNDLPPAGQGCFDLLYADDITQVVTTPSKSKLMMKIRLEREICRINRYEKQWKIKTNEEKFKIIPIAQYKTEPIIINGRRINTSKDGKFLGLKLQSTGLVGHATDKIKKGKTVVSKLTRFRNLTPKLKTTLVKTLLIPVIEYPPVPTCSLSKFQKVNFQKVLNKGLRFIHCNEPDNFTIEQLHQLYKIIPFNISIHNKAVKTWQIVRSIEEESSYEEIVSQRENPHNWFPKTTIIIQAPPPTPIFTSQR